jgi:hypothetical protein
MAPVHRLTGSLVFCLAAAAAGSGCQTHSPSESGSPATATGPTAVQCSVTLALHPSEFDQLGGSATLQVSPSPLTCAWQLVAPEWVRIDGPSTGRGAAERPVTILPTTIGREGAIEAVSGSNRVSIVQTPYRSVLSISSVWCGRFAAGTYAPLACAVFVSQPADPPYSTGLTVVADLRAFGRSQQSGVSKCPACGVPIEFDLDLNVPADMPAGTVPITFTASDAQGRTATATGHLEVVR